MEDGERIMGPWRTQEVERDGRKGKAEETAEEKLYRENFEDTERATADLWGRGPGAWLREGGLGELGWRGARVGQLK